MDKLFMFGSVPFGEYIDHWVYSEAEFQRRLVLTLQFDAEYALKHSRPATALEELVQIVKSLYHGDLIIALHTEALRLLTLRGKAVDEGEKAELSLKLEENKKLQHDYMRKTQ